MAMNSVEEPDIIPVNRKFLAEMNLSIKEIERTNKFIEKRLRQQEHVHQENIGEQEIHHDPLLPRLQHLEERDLQQSQDMKKLMDSVASLGDKINSICQTISQSNPSKSDTKHRKVNSKQKVSNQTDELQNTEADVDPDLVNGNEGESDDHKESSSDVNEDDELQSGRDQMTENVQPQTHSSSQIVEPPPALSDSSDANIDSYVDNIVRPKTRTVKGRNPPVMDRVASLGQQNSNYMQSLDMEEENGVQNEDWSTLVLEESERAKQSELPCGSGVDTVLVLDVSDNRTEELGLSQIQAVCHSILNGIEEAYEEENLKENVAIVTFGGEPKCAQFLTCDYKATRQCIDELTIQGNISSLHGGLQMSLAPIKDDGSETTVVHGWEVQPRIIIVSDDKVCKGQGTHSALSKEEKIMQFAQYLSDTKICVSCVSLGDEDEGILRTLTTITSGTYTTKSSAESLGRYFRNMVTAMKVRKEVSPADITRGDIEDAVKLMKRSTTTEQDITDILLILNNPNYKRCPHMDEDEDFLDLEETDDQMPPIGTRVKRGPDWKWKKQDSEGVGTVIGHGRNGWIKIEWDTTNKASYRYGSEGRYDVVVVDEPRILKDELIATGCFVKRVPQWRFGNQDGGIGSVGTVYKVEKNGNVWVKWPNKKKHQYKFGIDVEICNQSDIEEQKLREATGGDQIKSRSPSMSSASNFSDDTDPLDPFKDEASEPPDPMESLSIYDMAPPPVERDVNPVEEALQMSLVEAMNRRNELPQEDNEITPHQASETDDMSPSRDTTQAEVHKVEEEQISVNVPVGFDDITINRAAVSTSESDDMSLRPPQDQQGSVLLDQNLSSVEENGTCISNPSDMNGSGYPVLHEGDDGIISPASSSNDSQNVALLNDSSQSMASSMSMGREKPQSHSNSSFSVSLPHFPQNMQFQFKNESLNDKDRNLNQGYSENLKPAAVSDPESDVNSMSLAQSEADRVNHLQELEQNMVSSNSPVPSEADRENHLQELEQNMVSSNSPVPSEADRENHLQEPEQRESLSPLGTDNLELKSSKSLPEASNYHHGDQNFSVSKIDTQEKTEEIDQIENESKERVLDKGLSDSSQCELVGAMPPGLLQSRNEDLNRSMASLAESFSETASFLSDGSATTPTAVTWQWQDVNSNAWCSYPEEMNKRIEKAKKRGKKATAVVELGGEFYRVVIHKGIHIHTVSRETTKIRCLENSDIANLSDVSHE